MLNKRSKVDLSNYMIEKSEDCLEAAKLLMDKQYYDGSLSRSYYSFFASLRAVAAMDNVKFKKHSGIISYFRREYLKTGVFDKKYSKMIQNSFDIRNETDYEDFYIAFKADAEEQYKNAKEFLESVKLYLKDRIEKGQE